MRALITTTLCVFFLANFSFAQESEQIEGKIYRYAKVKLISGEILKGKDLSVGLSDLSLATRNVGWDSDGYRRRSVLKTFALSDVEHIQVATKNYFLTGTLIGLLFASGATLGIDNELSSRAVGYQTRYYHEYGWEDVTPIYHEGLTTITKVAIVVGGTGMGALIGYAIKGGWKKIYPFEKASNMENAQSQIATSSNEIVSKSKPSKPSKSVLKKVFIGGAVTASFFLYVLLR